MTVAHRLLLLRHGEVESHRGDVPITSEAIRRATDVGGRLGAHGSWPVRVLTGETWRTRQTADAIVAGARASGAAVGEAQVAFALRNPDLYVAGQPVNMVSSPTALAAQLDGIDASAAAKVPFFSEFFEATDRIGWWLEHRSPPGDGAQAVAQRITAFAASLADFADPALTVAVTHSPILRAAGVGLLGYDIGEPSWLSGLSVDVSSDRTLAASHLPEAP